MTPPGVDGTVCACAPGASARRRRSRPAIRTDSRETALMPDFANAPDLDKARADAGAHFLASLPPGGECRGRNRPPARHPRQGGVGDRRRGRALVRHHVGPLARQYRPRPAGDRGRGLSADAGTGLLAGRLREPGDGGAFGQARTAQPGRGGARLFRVGRLGGERDRAQACQELPPPERRADALEGALAARLLSRRHAGLHQPRARRAGRRQRADAFRPARARQYPRGAAGGLSLPPLRGSGRMQHGMRPRRRADDPA